MSVSRARLDCARFRDHTSGPGFRLAGYPDLSSSAVSVPSIGRPLDSERILGLASRPALAGFEDFSLASESSVSIGRPTRNGEGGAIMTARKVARYDANTLRSVRAIDLHNMIPSAELGGASVWRQTPKIRCPVSYWLMVKNGVGP